MQKFQEKLFKVSVVVNKNAYLSAMKDGFLLSMPFLVAGAFFMLIATPANESYQAFMSGIFGTDWSSSLWQIVHATFDITALIVVIGISMALAKRRKVPSELAGIMAFCLFIFFTSFSVVAPESGEVVKGIDVTYLGGSGTFVAIICAIVAVEIYSFCLKRNIVIKMPDAVPKGVADSFSCIIPIMLVFCVAIVVQAFIVMTGYTTLNEMIYTVLQKPLQGIVDGYFGVVLLVLVEQLFWFVGIHGGLMVNSLFDPILGPAGLENYTAYLAGEEMPYILTSSFRTVTNLTGGSGNTLSILIAVLIVARKSIYFSLAKVSAIPNAFNINEPVLFGMPIILNPILLIPWVIGPLITCLLTYFLMDIGVVNIPNGMPIPWTTPIFINGYLLGGISLVIMQAINLVILTLMYIPFIKTIRDSNKETND